MAVAVASLAGRDGVTRRVYGNASEALSDERAETDRHFLRTPRQSSTLLVGKGLFNLFLECQV